MKKLIFPSIVLALLVSQMSVAANVSCESLASLKLPDATITRAQSVAPGAFTTGGAGGRGGGSQFSDLPGFCRIAATLKPSSDSDIKIELLLPPSQWKGKFETVGKGGWEGKKLNEGMGGGGPRG